MARLARLGAAAVFILITPLAMVVILLIASIVIELNPLPPGGPLIYVYSAETGTWFDPLASLESIWQLVVIGALTLGGGIQAGVKAAQWVYRRLIPSTDLPPN